MAFLNALGAVSRQGQWRLRRVIRQVDPAFPDGRLDLSDDGLVEFPDGAEVVLTVTPRRPARSFACDRFGTNACEPAPILRAARSDGSLFVSSPGWVEAVFPAGWSTGVRPGLYDVRILLTIEPETALLFDEPIEIP